MSSIQNVHHTAPIRTTGKAQQPSLGVTDYVKLAAEKVLGKPAAPPKVADGLKSNDFHGVELAFRSLDKKERLAKLEEMRQQDPTSYKALLQDIRDGKIKDSNVTIPAGIDRLRSTRWAASGEGKEITAQVISQYEKPAKDPWAADSRISVDNTDGQSAKTQADNPGPEAGRNGKTAETSIFLSPALTGSPEVLAATLAHEGQHSLRNAKGSLKRELAEETDAYTNQSAVWKEFGGERLQSSNADTKQAAQELDSDASHYQPGNQNEMTGYVAGIYAQGHIHFGGKNDLKAANEILNDYLAGGSQVRKATPDDSAQEIYSAAQNLSQYSSEPEEYMKRFRGLSGH
ncbi:hypothetical protein ABS71_19225 [bacterium SCN 62-11]|nr:hypothetical protein [Candidatus Eremiobacteraeota bacterium]ODT57892.1 MAG: hypothetical protein ABS71_19225 [bacterium SCN 62-11]